ncbi:MAG: DUF1838 family protein [Pseudomonadota bacterium]
MKTPLPQALTRRLTLALTLTTALGAGSLATTASADEIDLMTQEGSVAANRKIQCSTVDEKPVVYAWYGKAYARVPGERDKHLFNLDGMNIRQCTTIEDPERGTGYRMVSREIMLYLDPQTNEVMRTWTNPWTDAELTPIHVANDPVNGRPNFGLDRAGNPMGATLMDINGTWLMPFEVPLFYTNVLGGDYQKYVGGTYHATEIFDFNGQMDELLDADLDTAHPVVSWVRISQWLPWMEMGGRAGIMYFNAMGKKLQSFDELSDTMKAEIAANYPEYTAPPPVDDTRPNETSWTFMKKILDEREGEAKPAGGH